MVRPEAQEDDKVVAGTILVTSMPLILAFGFGATHSFISTWSLSELKSPIVCL
jgi:hypothetical protein